jgi:hypothetical protein
MLTIILKHAVTITCVGNVNQLTNVFEMQTPYACMGSLQANIPAEKRLPNLPELGMMRIPFFLPGIKYYQNLSLLSELS